MTDPARRFQSLLRLLDDDNPEVRRAVKEALSGYEEDMDVLLKRYAPGQSPEIREQLHALIEEHGRDVFREHWRQWLKDPSSMDKLEDGLCLLASYLSPPEMHPICISEDLDQLARDFLQQYPDPEVHDLTAYLFKSGLFQGNDDNFYSPRNSNLAAVLRDGRGNQISLACICILVGLRAGFPVGGCNYPTHFLARIDSPAEDELLLIDCYNEGAIIPAEELIRHHPLSSGRVENVVRTPASAEVILARVLRNLEHVYLRLAQPEEQRFIHQLRKSLDKPLHD